MDLSKYDHATYTVLCIAIVMDNLTSVWTRPPSDVVSSDVLATNQLPTKERKSSLQLVTGNNYVISHYIVIIMCTVLAPVGLIFFLVGIALLVIPVGVCFLRGCSRSHLLTHRTRKQGTHNNYMQI